MSSGTESNPFVGLRSYESRESILFFGRNEQTIELLQRLHQYHFLAVIGSSGSGKSSLVKAGLIPQLKAGYLVNQKSRWIIASMRPGDDPLFEFGKALIGELNFGHPEPKPESLKENIQRYGVEAILDILRIAKNDTGNLFVVVDQFEELFRFVLSQNELGKTDEAIDFVNI